MLAIKLSPETPNVLERHSENFVGLLDFCYRAIGCDIIEIVHPRRLPSPYCMIVDEEGLLKGREINLPASVLYETDKHGQPIVGTALLMKEAMTDDGPDIVSLEDGDVEELLEIMQQAIYDIGR